MFCGSFFSALFYQQEEAKLQAEEKQLAVDTDFTSEFKVMSNQVKQWNMDVSKDR